MRPAGARWLPAVVLVAGVLLVQSGSSQRKLALRSPLERSVPMRLASYEGRDLTLSPEEREVSGVSEYLQRVYQPAGRPRPDDYIDLYVGYYDSQAKGRTIHSPKNCLPGAGWEPLDARYTAIAMDGGGERVNQYILQRGNERALVLYWYQGRGRVEANEYVVKWDLLRDAALRHRSEEALVRVVVPVAGDEEAALALATRAAREIIPAVRSALPI